MGDLELAVTDRLDEEAIDERERKALTRLRAQLRGGAAIVRCAFTHARSSRSSSSAPATELEGQRLIISVNNE